MKTKVTAVFDIGKTNKKFFLFDAGFQEVYREYSRFDEIKDEDGYPTEDIEALENWIKTVFDKMLCSQEFEITGLNFSSYGASFVHIDEEGKVVTPLYNYLKPLEDEVLQSFYSKYRPENELSRITGSPKLGRLNSGMQLYWLKLKRPSVYNTIKYTLHLPQYLSYLFTGVPVSEFTSIGCHTLLWDFEKKDYHAWVYKERINEKLPPISSTQKTVLVNYKGKNIEVGPGIHDSSSALIPYVRSISKPFLLVSTGTWSISINPFNKGMLTESEIENDSLFNMRIDGSPVKVSRLFLGSEYKIQVEKLTRHYGVADDYHKSVTFDKNLFLAIKKTFVPRFKWARLTSNVMPLGTELSFDKFEGAYHQLMLELVLLQVKSIQAAIGKEKINRLYIDGGFADNEVYIQLLSQYLAPMKLRTTNSSLGSALGAAIVISNATLEPKFLKKNYALKKHMPYN